MTYAIPGMLMGGCLWSSATHLVVYVFSVWDCVGLGHAPYLPGRSTTPPLGACTSPPTAALRTLLHRTHTPALPAQHPRCLPTLIKPLTPSAARTFRCTALCAHAGAVPASPPGLRTPAGTTHATPIKLHRGDIYGEQGLGTEACLHASMPSWFLSAIPFRAKTFCLHTPILFFCCHFLLTGGHLTYPCLPAPTTTFCLLTILHRSHCTALRCRLSGNDNMAGISPFRA